MRTIQKQIYKFKELKPEIQEKIIDKHREINVYDDWYIFNLESISDEIKEKTGISINHNLIQFEFMSRNNSIWIENKEILRALEQKYTNLIDLYIPEKFGAFCYYLGGGLCSGLNVSEFDKEHITLENEFNEDEENLKFIIQEKKNKKIKENICNDLKIIQNILSKGYKGIYESYDNLTSDESIKDTLEINLYEFDENGGII